MFVKACDILILCCEAVSLVSQFLKGIVNR